MTKERSRAAKRSEEELLDIKQAASLLNVSEASLRRWTDSGKLPCYRVGDQRARRFRREDLVAFVSVSQETASPAQGADRPDSVKNAAKTQVAGMDIAYHDHICAIYGRPAGRLKLSVPLLREGLKAGDICFLNATQPGKAHILKVLREVYPDVHKAIKDGQLIFPALKRNKAEMLDQLEEMFLKATYSGEQKLRLVGDMEWALSVDWSEQEVYEYELEYNNTLGHRFPIISLCQYDVRVFSSKGILDALKSHEDTYKYPLRDCCI
ncbi:MEDS domain-containing protein [Ancylobacter dichloromethanicus]|uniref:Transcriptional repressor DcmR n=3 Tax=Hyphomicrobiales TaxID=356 RepID=DCMR_METED|nr:MULTISPECIES: transcriptional repressor DcmR [Hyphomicrobiales]P45876.1 RecName: Full=Transcriptional repressor DcmR [Methylorubrum extorquens DM4]AAB68953.1 regulatory protein [Methylorubrum extorquens DM4]ADJ22530.1 DNA binding domain protein, excisionase family [Hyphomicrobium denitrificans ATCC 51888]MBS7552976.1 MEDS domain-containing protein [Ancylobacter dichloromethanicus]CAX24311.1 transcriptional regulator of DCM dehalogenase [Methylorubrum extorquens DM4]CEJ88055.1 transcription